MFVSRSARRRTHGNVLGQEVCPRSVSARGRARGERQMVGVEARKPRRSWGGAGAAARAATLGREAVGTSARVLRTSCTGPLCSVCPRARVCTLTPPPVPRHPPTSQPTCAGTQGPRSAPANPATPLPARAPSWDPPLQPPALTPACPGCSARPRRGPPSTWGEGSSSSRAACCLPSCSLPPWLPELPVSPSLRTGLLQQRLGASAVPGGDAASLPALLEPI